MDPITHTLAGAAMARGGLDRRTPLAIATLMLAANAPDIDIVSMFAGPYDGLAFRRGWTHGPLALLVLPFVVTGLVLAWDLLVRRRRDPSLAPAVATATLLISFIGVISHPALDWLNTYGIRLLMPFSGRWFHGDGLFIIDPWVWLALGLALMLPRRTARRVRVAGTAVAVYAVLMAGASRAAEVVAWRTAESLGVKDIVEVLYTPQPALPLVGGLIVATATEYRYGSFHWLAGGRAQLDGDVIARGDWDQDVVRRARRVDDVRNYLIWSHFPFVRAEAGAGGTTVSFGDARFVRGPSGGGLQGVSVVVSPD